jgi:hypothetical protein
MVYGLVTLHIWGRIFKMFPDLRGLAYADDATIIGRLSQALKLAAVSKPMFKSDGNLDFNMDKTEFLAKGPTARHVFERAQYFLQTDPDLQGIANDFTPEIFTVTGIEVLGTPIGSNAYIKDFVAQNCIKIMRDVGKLEPMTDGFTHFQLVQKTMNTRTQYMSANITLPPQEQFLTAQHIHIDTAIAKAILQKGTRGSFHHWARDDYDLAVTMLQMPHALGGFGLTPNVLAQISAKVAVTSRFLKLVGSLPLEEQKLWLPNQLAHDPDSWTTPHFLNLKTGYDILVNKHNCKVQEIYTVQDHPPSPNEPLLLPPLDSLHKAHVRNQELPQTGDSRPVNPPSQRAISKQMMKKWEPWETNTQKSNNPRMLQQLAFHTQQIIKATSTQDLDPRPLANYDHPSVLPFEMYAIEPGEPPSRSLSWKPLGFLSHIMRHTNSDRFPLSLWEVWFCSTIGVPLPVLIGPSQQCACNNFQHDCFGDHLQTCKVKSAASQVHDWVVYRLGGIFGSVGHRVKIHKITPATGKERGDLEIKDYVVLQKPLEQADRLPPPRTLILDFTLTHTRFGSSHVHTTGQLTNTRRSDGAPELDGALREVARKKILHYRQLYLNRPDPIAFLPAAADTTGRVYDDFSRLLFLHAHREASALSNEIPEESDQFRFLRAARYANIKGLVGLILAKASAMRISIPLDLSSRPFIPLPRFICRRRPLPLLASSLVFTPRRSA